MTAVMERQNTKTLATNEPQNGQLLQSDLSNTPILELTWPLFQGSLIDPDEVTRENMGMVDFLWRTLFIPGMEMKKSPSWHGSPSNFRGSRVIFFGWAFDFKDFNHYGGGFKHRYTYYIYIYMYWMLKLKTWGRWTDFDSDFVLDVLVATTNCSVTIVQFHPSQENEPRVWKPAVHAAAVRQPFRLVSRNESSPGQWLNFKLSGITCLVGKIKSKLFVGF